MNLRLLKFILKLVIFNYLIANNAFADFRKLGPIEPWPSNSLAIESENQGVCYNILTTPVSYNLLLLANIPEPMNFKNMKLRLGSFGVPEVLSSQVAEYLIGRGVSKRTLKRFFNRLIQMPETDRFAMLDDVLQSLVTRKGLFYEDPYTYILEKVSAKLIAMPLEWVTLATQPYSNPIVVSNLRGIFTQLIQSKSHSNFGFRDLIKNKTIKDLVDEALDSFFETMSLLDIETRGKIYFAISEWSYGRLLDLFKNHLYQQVQYKDDAIVIPPGTAISEMMIDFKMVFQMPTDLRLLEEVLDVEYQDELGGLVHESSYYLSNVELILNYFERLNYADRYLALRVLIKSGSRDDRVHQALNMYYQKIRDNNGVSIEITSNREHISLLAWAYELVEGAPSITNFSAMLQVSTRHGYDISLIHKLVELHQIRPLGKVFSVTDFGKIITYYKSQAHDLESLFDSDIAKTYKSMAAEAQYPIKRDAFLTFISDFEMLGPKTLAAIQN